MFKQIIEKFVNFKYNKNSYTIKKITNEDKYETYIKLYNSIIEIKYYLQTYDIYLYKIKLKLKKIKFCVDKDFIIISWKTDNYWKTNYKYKHLHIVHDIQKEFQLYIYYLNKNKMKKSSKIFNVIKTDTACRYYLQKSNLLRKTKYDYASYYIYIYSPYSPEKIQIYKQVNRYFDIKSKITHFYIKNYKLIFYFVFYL